MTTEECGKSYICDKNPIDCKSSDTCETLIMYKNDVVYGTLDVILAISSVHKYIGWAQSNKKEGMVLKNIY